MVLSFSIVNSLPLYPTRTCLKIGEASGERTKINTMNPYPHPRSKEALKGLAAYRGAQAGCNYAENQFSPPFFECAFKRGLI